MTKHRVRIIVTATALLLSVLSFPSAKADPKPKAEKGPDRTLTVTLDGNGAGTVTSDPTGINCPQTCSASFKRKTVVTLTAAPAPHSVFGHWNAADCDTATTCTVTLDDTMSVTATFYAGDAMCGSQPQTVHVNGLGQYFFDCSPSGFSGQYWTYTEALAVEAAMAWSNRYGQPTTAICNDNHFTHVVVASGVDGSVAVWAYTGPNAGFVSLSPDGTCPDRMNAMWG